MTAYAALWCKSNFSFLEGASHPEELVEAASAAGVEGLALTDRDGVYGVVEAHVKARELGLHLIIGSEVTLDDGSTMLLLATDSRGYANLCGLLTLGRRRSAKGECVVHWRELCAHAEGVLALWGGERSLLVAEPDPVFVAHDLRDAFDDRLYALVARHRRAEEPRQEARLRQRAERYGLPVVAGMEVLYHKPSRRELQDTLTCIRHRLPLTEAGRLIKPNAEHALKSPHAFSALFTEEPAEVARTLEIAGRCRFNLDSLRYRYPSERLPMGATSAQWLRQLTIQGAHARFGETIPADMIRQLDRELALIDELNYCGYFLTMWEIVRFCREQGILCQGRGSAANSAVCYCLRITAVDPVRMGLLFERFLSKERAEPPDIDLDIEHNRREEVIQHVYEKYGRSHAAMVANFIRYRPRSAVRDVGKVLGVPETALDRLSKLMSHHGGLSPEALDQAGLASELPVHRHMLRLSQEVLDFPRHLSIHPGGFLLGHRPVSELVPIENGAMPDRTVIQWDKNCLEELGLFKVDLLGLGALHQLHLGFDLLKQHQGQSFSMATIPPADKPTFDMICKADTVGVFQIESRAQMAMLPRLLPREYYDLVIEVSIVRPGPITGGMVHPYLRRRSGLEPVVYPHPCLEPVLKKTLGVPLFQEQVIRLAVVAADYTPGEADQLRRDMAAWRRSGRIERHRERLVRRMTRKGIEPEFAERVFEQIRGFGEYGFPESHAASFALIAYATAWMKCHHPDAFACSLLNAQPMGFYASSTIIDDAKRHGVEVRPVDVQTSRWDCTLERPREVPDDPGKSPTTPGSPRRPREVPDDPGKSPTTPGSPRRGTGDGGRGTGDGGPAGKCFAIRIGLRYVKGLSRPQGERIERARDDRAFASAEDFVERTGLDEGTVSRLAEAGALSAFDSSRRSALWKVRGVPPSPKLRRTGHHVSNKPLELKFSEPAADFEELDAFETIHWDYRTTGNSPRGHPLAPLREKMRGRNLPDAKSVTAMADGQRVRYAGIVICRQRPGTASGVVFMTLEDETGFVNVVTWSKVFDEFALLIKTTSFLGVSGKLQVQDGVVHVIAESFWRPPIAAALARTASHDFH